MDHQRLLLALAVALITAGKLGDRFGHRQTFLIGVVGFAAASGAIGLSGSVALVVTFRVLQGLFGALLMPAALGLLRATFPAEKLNMAIGIWGMVIGASTAGGPIVGGLLVEHVNWQSVFFINVPVGVIALVLGLVILQDHRARERAPLLRHPGHRAAVRRDVLPDLGAHQGAGRGAGATHETWGFLGAAVVALRRLRASGSKVTRAAASR